MTIIIAGTEEPTMEMLANLTLPQLLALQWGNNLVRYFLIAGLSYLIFWKWCFPFFKHRFLYSQQPQGKDIRREIFFSILSTFIFLLPTIILVSTKDLGWSKVYLSLEDKGVAWYSFSFVLVFFLHDTYFYWTHRFMHLRKVYRYFHRTHHLSVEPTPLAAFAFHPLEALVESFLFLLIPLIMPVHISVLIIFTLFSLFMNVYGHLGFNLVSPDNLKKFPYNLFSHSTHHSWHHRYQLGNYGFYLQFWDRLMGTWRGDLSAGNVKSHRPTRNRG